MYIIGEKYEKTRRKAVLLTPGYRLSAIRLRPLREEMNCVRYVRIFLKLIAKKRVSANPVIPHEKI